MMTQELDSCHLPERPALWSRLLSFGLGQSYLLQAFREWHNRWKIQIPFPFSIPNQTNKKIKNIVCKEKINTLHISSNYTHT